MSWPRRFVQESLMIVAALAMTFVALGLLSEYSFRRGGNGVAPSLNLAELCLEESNFMASQATRCREQDVQGVPFETNTEFTRMLKVCPYVVDDREDETWEAQARVWDRAASRSLAASRKAR